MFPSTKKVKVGNKEVICMDMTFGYIVGIENGTISDTIENAVLNGTNLTQEEVHGLRKREVELLYSTILRLTYPEIYDEDGNMKSLPKSDNEDSKKKA